MNRTIKISYDEINYESVAISFKDKQVNINYILIHNHHVNHLNSIASYSSCSHHLQFSSQFRLYYLDSHMYHVDSLPRSECSTYIASYGLNELTIYTSGLICTSTVIRTIRVWLYHMRIHVWYVPYAYGINTRMVQILQNSYIHSYSYV